MPQPASRLTEPPVQDDRRDTALEDQKRTFLRMVSHELRTPLNSILGFSEIISRELYGPLGAPQYKEYAHIIQASGLKLLRLVNQVLEIARLEGRALDLTPQAEPLDHVLDDVLDTLSDDLNSRRTEVQVSQFGELPSVLADPRGVRTALVNLIQNACLHGPEGGVVRVWARRTGEVVEIVVSDDGPGVDPAEIPRLLQPSEQGDGPLTRKSQGAGLGLPIVHLLCVAMDGRLELSSAPGQGLTARMLLPAA